MTNSTLDTEKCIIFFDGVCGLCNIYVDLLIRIDRKKKFLFAPLQGKEAIKRIPREVLTGVDSIVVYSEGNYVIKSLAIKKVIFTLGFPWVILGVFMILPTRINDWLYDKIAGTRYSIFGKKEQCRVPTEKERGRFLD